jgi:hypothetical protein
MVDLLTLGGTDHWLVVDASDPDFALVGEVRFVRGLFEISHPDGELTGYAFRDLRTAVSYFDEYIRALGLGTSERLRDHQMEGITR